MQIINRINLLLLYLVLINSFNIGIFFPDLFMNEAGLAMLVVLYGICLFTTPIPSELYFKYAVAPLFIITGWILLYAGVFYLNTGASYWASIMAQRNFFYFLLIPVIVMMRYNGLKTSSVEKILLGSMAVITVIYFILYVLLYIPVATSVMKHLYLNIIGVDQNRGIRIKGPMFIIIVSLIYYIKKLKQVRSYQMYGLLWVCILMDLVIIYLHQPRALLLGAVLAFILMKFSQMRTYTRLRNAMTVALAISLLVTAVLWSLPQLGERFEGNFSLSSRIFSAGIALRTINQYPIFGLGYASHHSVAYQKLFGDSFYPDDIGILGVIFQFGLLGGFVYLYLIFWLVKNAVIQLRAWKADDGNWSRGFTEIVVFASLMMAMIMPTIAKVFREDGIGMSALIVGTLLSNKLFPTAAE